MSRSLEFDKQQPAADAMELFWRSGFQATLPDMLEFQPVLIVKFSALLGRSFAVFFKLGLDAIRKDKSHGS